MFKDPMIGIETIVFSYWQTKDTGAFINPNKLLSRYFGLKFKDWGHVAARFILSIDDPDWKIPEDTDDTAGKVAFLK